MKTIKLLAIISLLVLFQSSTFAEIRLATIDVNRALNEFSEAKEKKKGLDERSADAKKKLEEKGKSLKETEKKIQSGKIQQDSKEAENFRVEAREFSRLVKDTEDELRKEFAKVNKALAGKVFKAVDDYAKKNKIDLVLDKSEPIRGPVLFGNPSTDITDEIIKEMNHKTAL